MAKKFTSLLLGIILCVSLIPSALAAGTTVTPISEVNTDELTIDWSDPLNSLIFGMYSHEVTVGEETRTVYQYIPTTWKYGQPEVTVAVPSGKDPIEFFEETGWKAASEAGPFAVVLMTADSWANQDDYIEAVWTFMNNRQYAFALKVAFYMVGYGDAANPVMKFALSHNELLAGFAALGVDGFDNRLLSLGNEFAVDQQGAATDVKRSDVAIPVWIGVENKNAAAQTLINYWKKADRVSDEQFFDDYADEIYFYPSYLSNTYERANKNIASVYVTEGLDGIYTPEFTNNLYFNFLGQVRRTFSEKIRPLKWYAPADELGFAHKTFTLKETRNGQEVDVGREYWVYVPTKLRNSSEKAPLVFVAHGIRDSGEEFITVTNWYKCAEERGFILVHMMGERNGEGVTASTRWTTDSGIAYFKAVRTAMLQDYGRNIDTSRIYLTGHSNGGMLTHDVIKAEPSLVAAACSNNMLTLCSAITAEEYERSGNTTVPMMVNMGTMDNICPYSNEESQQKVVNYFKDWCSVYGMDYENSRNFKNGLNFGTEYLNGQGIPVVKMQWNEGKYHCMDSNDPYSIYDFLCNFSRGDDNTSYYMGVAIEVGGKDSQGTEDEAAPALIEEDETAAGQPETDAPETNQPETDEPEASQPETDEPEANQPETDEPEASQPGTDEPEAGQPGTDEPEAGQPETDEPEAGQPGNDETVSS